ncbi:thiamine phosphate synthase [Echinicola sediminis]
MVLITDPGKPEGERDTLIQLMDQGLLRVHIRKPEWSGKEVEDLLKQIPEKYYPKISLHGDVEMSQALGLGGCHYKQRQFPSEQAFMTSKSFHGTEELLKPENSTLDYAFLSPVFDSLSKSNYQAAFNYEELKAWLAAHKRKLGFSLFALGGISPDKVVEAKQLGFDGIAVLGAIWGKASTKERLVQFQQFQQQIHDAK